MTYKKAAELLLVSKTTLHSYIKAGKLTKYNMIDGGKPYLRISKIEALMKNSRRVNPNLSYRNLKRA